jgi:hypothetical protein
MSALCCVPVELLILIAEHVADEETYFEEAESLHLTHPHFANMDNLRDRLSIISTFTQQLKESTNWKRICLLRSNEFASR